MVGDNEWQLVACARYGVVGLAILAEGGIIFIARHRIDRRGRRTPVEYVEYILTRIARDYSFTRIVVEEGSIVAEAARRAHLDTVARSLANIRKRVAGAEPTCSRREFYRRLVEQFPVIGQLVKKLELGDIAAYNARGSAIVDAVALGLLG